MARRCPGIALVLTTLFVGWEARGAEFAVHGGAGYVQIEHVHLLYARSEFGVRNAGGVTFTVGGGFRSSLSEDWSFRMRIDVGMLRSSTIRPREEGDIAVGLGELNGATFVTLGGDLAFRRRLGTLAFVAPGLRPVMLIPTSDAGTGTSRMPLGGVAGFGTVFGEAGIASKELELSLRLGLGMTSSGGFAGDYQLAFGIVF